MISPNPQSELQRSFESTTASDTRLIMPIAAGLRDNQDEFVVLHEFRDDVLHSKFVDYSEQRGPFHRVGRLHGVRMGMRYRKQMHEPKWLRREINLMRVVVKIFRTGDRLNVSKYYRARAIFCKASLDNAFGSIGRLATPRIVFDTSLKISDTKFAQGQGRKRE